MVARSLGLVGVGLVLALTAGVTTGCGPDPSDEEMRDAMESLLPEDAVVWELVICGDSTISRPRNCASGYLKNSGEPQQIREEKLTSKAQTEGWALDERQAGGSSLQLHFTNSELDMVAIVRLAADSCSACRDHFDIDPAD
jgi:hypothetical protein